MEEIFTALTNIFSLEYMLSVILASYFLIKVADTINGKKVVPAWLKRIISVLVGVAFFVIFKVFTDVSIQCLITSFFTAVFIYDSAIKFLLKKFNVSYRKKC